MVSVRAEITCAVEDDEIENVDGELWAHVNDSTENIYLRVNNARDYDKVEHSYGNCTETGTLNRVTGEDWDGGAKGVCDPDENSFHIFWPATSTGESTVAATVKDQDAVRYSRTRGEFHEKDNHIHRPENNRQRRQTTLRNRTKCHRSDEANHQRHCSLPQDAAQMELHHLSEYRTLILRPLLSAWRTTCNRSSTVCLPAIDLSKGCLHQPMPLEIRLSLSKRAPLVRPESFDLHLLASTSAGAWTSWPIICLMVTASGY